jgi:tetratricopeptide (TPR) repeat protein
MGTVFAAVSTHAQNAPVSGVVELNTNGTKSRVAGAQIEVYRTDIKAGFPSTKTAKNGEFRFAGMPIGATFAFAVSAPGCAPIIYPNVKAGQEKLLITMVPGDGKKMTEAEARSALAQNVGRVASSTEPELTAEQKKEQAAYEAKLKEVEAKNARAGNINEVVNRTLKEGNDAYTAKNYDLAISKYTEGIDADPTYVGTAPVMLNNRAASYSARGTESYNKNIKSTDASVRAEAKANAKRDFGLAAESYKQAYDVVKNAAPADISDPKNVEASKFASLRGARDVARLSVAIEQVDDKVIAVDKELVPEYIAAETDPAKKAEASMILADLYRVAADFENAIAGYRKILEVSPDNVDALAGAGLSLINVGYIENDKNKLQEGSNYLQKFITLAPDAHKYKADAVGLIDSLKKQNNVTPQKVPAASKKKP